MNAHLTDQQLNGYIHQTLNDAQRETLDAHLASCPTCRACLSEVNVLQQRLHGELAAELKAATVPLSLTFEAIAPQLKQRRFLVFRRLVIRMTAVATAAAVIIVLVILANNSQSAPTSTVDMPAANQVATVTTLGLSPDANGWFLAGSAPEDFEAGTDHAVAYDGKSSGYISATVRSSAGFGTLMQMFKADKYLGKRLRLSAYVKTERVDSCGLWMRIDGSGKTMLSLDNMQNRPIHWTTDWQKIEVVLDVPQNSVDIAFGVLLQGGGRVWIDEVQFDIVNTNIPTTGIQILPSTIEAPQVIHVTPAPLDRTLEQQPVNLDFETGSTGWSTADGDAQQYVVGIDPTVAHLGQASGSIESLVPKPGGLGLLHQTVQAGEYRNKRVRISGYLKADRLDGEASFYLTIYGQQDQMIYANSRSIEHSTDWEQFWFVLNVPVNSDRIEYGLALRGEGQAWIDDVHMEDVEDNVELSSLQPLSPPVGSTQLGNLDFESYAEQQSWLSTGNPDYTVGVDHDVVHSGKSSGYIQSKATASTGSYEQSHFKRAIDYRGKRLRLSGYIKTEQVTGRAGIWVSVVDSSNQLLGLDNMQNRPITGTTNWQKYEIVLDIPEDSATIWYGVLLQGEGKIWLDDAHLEVVEQDISTTDSHQQQPLNLDFEDLL